ncbi:MAG TPA: DedA family protein [Chthoniobacterales bacterium]|jgi:membrane protein DedA with SNARE-associated domain
MFHHLLEVWFGWVLHGGYWGIIGLMAMESSVIPVPSEMVIPPAAFLAAQGNLSLTGVILAGTFGAYLGAAISYWISLWVGRPFILHFGKYFFISREHFERAENWLERYEAGGVFFARLLPVIRHLISIPAGIVRMSFGIFSLTTVAGAGIWCCVLAYLGEKAYRVRPDLISNPDAWIEFTKDNSKSIVIIAFVLLVLYILMLRLSAKRPADATK